MRPSKVIYDRAHSAMAEAVPEDFDFDAIMQGADWFHWSGITPALSAGAAQLVQAACRSSPPAPRYRVGRFELPPETLDSRTGPGNNASLNEIR